MLVNLHCGFRHFIHNITQISDIPKRDFMNNPPSEASWPKFTRKGITLRSGRTKDILGLTEFSIKALLRGGSVTLTGVS
jgi:hypothetical protein